MKTVLVSVALLLVLIGVSLSGCGVQVATSATPTPAVQTITVTLTDSGVIASQSTFRPGIRCHFIVTNRGTLPHQFWLMPEGMAHLMSNMPMAQWRQQVLFSTQDIGPGMMSAADYTFPNSMMHHKLAFGCYTTDGHAIMEMPIRVSP